jgi:hypothetical protein
VTVVFRREGEERPIPVSQQRIISQQAASTIKNIVDAIVELVTNSDDSYKRLEDVGIKTNGSINIGIKRLSGGQCSNLLVTDFAEGMSLIDLEAAIEFGGETSGFLCGRSVRGLFGKGLKEAIIALGEGQITSVRDGYESSLKIGLDSKSNKYLYRIIKDTRETTSKNGTSVSIEVKNDKVKAPGFNALYSSLSRHFALRDINRNPNRDILLRVDDVRINRSKPVKYYLPEGRLITYEKFNIPDLGECVVEIYEANDKLDYNSYDPSSETGILVKSNGIILDNRLFGFDNDEAAHFFFGWVDCPGISEAIRHGDQSIIDPNRTGLDWRYHLCKEMSNSIHSLLLPLIENKKKELEITRRTTVKEEYKEKLSSLCSLLNQLAQEELDELTGPWRTPLEIDTLAIRPDVGYAEPYRRRAFSVYIPKSIIDERALEPVVNIELSNVIGQVELIDNTSFMNPHPDYERLLLGYFRIMGKEDKSSAYIVAKLSDLEDVAEFRVRQPGKRSPSGSPKRRTGGLFRDIEFDERTPEPIQRVSFTQGVITVYLNFSPIKDYIKPGGEGISTYQGSLMLAELVSEAFCTELARRRIEAGTVPIVPGAEIDGYRSEVNKLMRKYLRFIHKTLILREV